MIETPEIVKTQAQPTAAIQVTVAREEIRTVMGPGLRELSDAVAEQELEVTGPWFTHHFRRPTDVFDFEICLPVKGVVAASGRVRPGELPAATVARTVYRGGYEGLGAAWGELQKWIAENGHTPAKDFWGVLCGWSGFRSEPFDVPNRVEPAISAVKRRVWAIRDIRL